MQNVFTKVEERSNMNEIDNDILLGISRYGFVSQRKLSETCNYSLGAVNKALKDLCRDGYLDEDKKLTDKGRALLEACRPESAIILAAGYGVRMFPINAECHKALLKVKGEVLIERVIRQLHLAGVKKIYVVVGFMKEKLEYLIDQYGVELIFNPEYERKNNLYSLKKVAGYINNTYIIPCDIWCRDNPFAPVEINSWYMLKDVDDADSTVYLNRKSEVTRIKGEAVGKRMVGIAYINYMDAGKLKSKIEELCKDKSKYNSFWEDALYEKDKMYIPGKMAECDTVFEINTYDELMELDSSSNNLKGEAVNIICNVFGIDKSEIRDVRVMKKGMTNRSFIFECKGIKYIIRVPGEGTDELINRRNEANVYKAIGKYNLSDEVVYIDGERGYKITRFVGGARNCNIHSEKDLASCMEKLREFHKMELKVEHEFNVYYEIERYESLWNGLPSVYKDYGVTKANVLSLRDFVEKNIREWTLCHIDANNDNFLITDEDIRLIDWEYAGMQDPDMDIAMFAIYAMYDREQIDRLIDIYCEGECEAARRIKIYCYCATCGLLWSNWCEYKRNLGIDFGEYSLRQYRYAKEYYKIAIEEMEKLN